ncbi:Toll-Like Receptor 10, partial [Manis pentadactyla]
MASPRKSLIKKTGAKIWTLSENCNVIPEERIPTEPPPLLSTLGDSQQKWLQVASPDFHLRSLKA